jgi:hypothetical protein
MQKIDKVLWNLMTAFRNAENQEFRLMWYKKVQAYKLKQIRLI